MKVRNIFKHLNKICIHKFWVGYYCFKLGIPWRGIKHDMSKFSFTEFWEGVKYYQGNRSPIDACKQENGWSKAWLHHKGRNDHHYEYFIDNLDNGGIPLIMPFNCALEMFCDYLGAGRAYSKNNFTFEGEYNWWLNKCSNAISMNFVIKYFITKALNYCRKYNKLPSKKLLQFYYNIGVKYYG